MWLNGYAHVMIKQMALGATDGEASFLVSAEPTWGKLASIGSTVSKQVGEMAISVRRLDSLLAEDGLSAPDLIKIDVEGAEVDVLSGSNESLRRARPILIIELHGTNIGVSAIFKALDYHAVVLGSSAAMVDSPWDAYVIAAPME